MSITITMLKDGKEHIGKIDIDGDIFTSYPLLENSLRIVSDETGVEFYVTEIYDLFANCQEFKIEKK